MRENNKIKIVLSLLIALAFILPAASAFVSSVEKVDARDGQKSVKNEKVGINEPPESLGLLAPAIVTITGINLLPNMGTGDYDINVTLQKFGAPPQCCDVKLFCDVFKLDPLPIEQMYCTDFEDMADVMNHWDSYNLDSGPILPGGSVDTWTISYRRANSGSFSFKNTQFDDAYMGNQIDWLETKITNPAGKYDIITVNFSQWMKGELIDGGGFGDIPEDYGQIQYSTDHTNPSSWVTVPTWQWIDEPADVGVYTQQMYTSTDGWEDVTGKFGGMDGVPEFWLRFYWVSGPTIQNEGWYVDDVCVSGTYSPDPDFLFQTHSLGAITVCDLPVVYTFPTTWHAEEGTYHFEIWMLDDTLGPDPCDVEYPQSNKYMFDCEIGDFVDLEVLSNSYIGGPAFDMGDDLIVSTSITNHGTVDALNVPVTFSVKPQLKTTHVMDYVEGTYYPVTYNPYSDTGIWDAVNFGATDQIGEWHIDDFQSVSPTHSWFVSDATNHYPAGLSDCLAFKFADAGIDIGAYADAVKFDLTGKLNFKLDTFDRVYLGVVVGNTWISIGGTGTRINTLYGADTAGWVDFSFDQIFQLQYGVSWMERVENPSPSPPFYGYGTSWADVKGIFLMLDDTHRDGTNGEPTGAWSGVMLDSIKVESVVAGAPIYTQIIIVDDILAETPSDPAEIEILTDKFAWLDMPTGDYMEEKSVPLDDPNPYMYINLDNSMMKPFTVSTLITVVDETEVEHMDLTECGDSFWHITTSGFDNYLWCGEEDTGVYPASLDDVICLTSPDNSAHPECPVSMDWSGQNWITLEFDDYQDVEVYDYSLAPASLPYGIQCSDFGEIEVNPHVSEPGSHWYRVAGAWNDYYGYLPFTTDYPVNPYTGVKPVLPAWQSRSLTLNTNDFFNDWLWEFMDVAEGLPAFTDDMGIRFRFTSDGADQFRGWIIDDIKITTSAGTAYPDPNQPADVNPCDNMELFEECCTHAGDYWFLDAPGWSCYDQVNYALYGVKSIPPNVECALIWDTAVPHATSAILWFDYDFDLNIGEELCYLEFSTDGGGLWVAPVAFTGIDAGTYEFDMSTFTGENVLIRWRIVSDDYDISLGPPYDTTYFYVENMMITGQVDLNPPVTTATLSGTVIHGWFNSAVTFTATATDDNSGVDATYYKIDGGATLTYSSPVSIAVAGTHYVEYWSVDNAGNVEVHKTTATFKVDTGALAVAITAPTPGLYLFGSKLLSMSKIIIIGAFTIEATASDVGSGVASVEFFLDGTSIGSDISSPYSILCSAKHMGAGSIKAVVTDYADNKGEATLDITYFKFL